MSNTTEKELLEWLDRYCSKMIVDYPSVTEQGVSCICSDELTPPFRLSIVEVMQKQRKGGYAD